MASDNFTLKCSDHAYVQPTTHRCLSTNLCMFLFMKAHGWLLADDSGTEDPNMDGKHPCLSELSRGLIWWASAHQPKDFVPRHSCRVAFWNTVPKMFQNVSKYLQTHYSQSSPKVHLAMTAKKAIRYAELSYNSVFMWMTLIVNQHEQIWSNRSIFQKLQQASW